MRPLMLDHLDQEVRRWTLMAFGFAIGTAARYAMRIQDNQSITWREVVADALLTSFNVILASWAARKLGADGEYLVLIAALFAVAQDRVTRVALRRFDAWVTRFFSPAGLDGTKGDGS